MISSYLRRTTSRPKAPAVNERPEPSAFRAPSVPPRSCPLPQVTASLGSDPDHFVVEEIPAYPLSDEGEHVFLWIEKRGLNTPDIAKRLADATSTKERDIGYAGMKDKHAVTRQWFSVLYKGDDAAQLNLGQDVCILEARRHNNKLRTGHLIGNRFTLTLLGASVEDQLRALAIGAHLRQWGLANYYGAQRFGHRGRNLEQAMRWLTEQTASKRAAGQTDLTEQGRGRDSRRSRHKKPGRFDNKLHPSVIQSEFFNRYVTARLKMPDELLLGEVVRLSGTGTHFVVQDVEKELPRKRTGDLILTGAMPGPKTLQSEHASAALEQQIWSDLEVTDEQKQALFGNAPGARRDVMMTPEELSCVSVEDRIVLSFSLPAGGYATQVVREFNNLDWMNPRSS